MDMSQMTHYMGLLADNQPWNLIIYMVVPVVLAESLVATEFIIVFNRMTTGALRTLNKYLGITAGIYFTGIFLNLLFTAIPSITWNTWVDVVAVWSYLLGVVPLGAIALMELGLLHRGKSEQEKMRIHFLWLTGFLVIAHVAMIFGMVNPTIISGSGAAPMQGHGM